MSERDEWIIYPEYFDARLSRRLGRKLPLKYCINSPKLEEVYESVKRIKIHGIRIEKDKSHPANWFEHKGRIVIPKIPGISKHRLLFQIAKELRIVRAKMIKREKLKKAEEKKKRKKSGVERYLEKIMQKKGK